jgi:hypothetical protein
MIVMHRNKQLCSEYTEKFSDREVVTLDTEIRVDLKGLRPEIQLIIDSMLVQRRRLEDDSA